MKRQLFYNGKEVHLGDVITDKGKIGDVTFTFTFNLDNEETISNCIKEGILTVKYIKDDPKVNKEFCKEVPNKFNIPESWQYYIRRFIERYNKESTLPIVFADIFISDLFVHDIGLFFSILAKEIAKALEYYYTTPRCLTSTYEISINGKVSMIADKNQVDNSILDSIACFRTEEDAQLALKILKRAYKELKEFYKDTKSEK